MKSRHALGDLAEDVKMLGAAMMGDIVAEVTPFNTSLITFTNEAGAAANMAEAAAWSCAIEIALKDAAGNVHTWMNEEIDAILSIADTQGVVAATYQCIGASGAGKIKFKRGKAVIIITGPSAIWAASVTTLSVAAMTINGATVACADPTVTFS